MPLGLLFAGLAAAAGPEPAGGLPVLTHARDIRNLSPDEAKRAYPVHLRAVVTFVDTGGGEMFVQDETAGVFVFEHDSVSNAVLHAGQIVDLTGITTPVGFTPSITQAHLNVLGQGVLPKPERRPMAELVSGEEDSQWFELQGVVHSGQAKEGRLSLNVDAAGGAFVAVMHEFPIDWNRKWIDATVVVRGVLAAIYNENRQAEGVRIFVPGPNFITIAEATQADVFRLPEAAAVSVGQFHPLDKPQKRVRVRGTVAAQEPGKAMYVADATGNLEVRPIPRCAAQPGDLVDVVGFPGVIEGRPGLEDTLCRKAGQGLPIAIIPVEAQDVIAPQVPANSSVPGVAAGSRYDGRLIRLEGTLVGISYHPEAATLLLKAGKQSFTATLPTFATQELPQLEAGSHLRLTGVCLVTYDPYHRAQTFRILLRTPDDIVTLARPSWWTLERSLRIVCLLAVVCLAAFTWISLLRRHVARQTGQLRLANERLMELSTHDPLTHAFNRRHFDQILESELLRAGRSGRPLSLVMADIDRFKSLNDKGGHLLGDDCLVQVVRALQTSAQRSADLVARYGGEEFAIILPETDRDGALRIAESMRVAVIGLAMPNPGTPFDPLVTISAGVTTFQMPAELSAARVVETADRALYEAKRLGRNRVVHRDMLKVPVIAG